MTNASEREVSAAVLEADNNKAGEHFSGRVRDMVFLGCISWLLIELCFFTYVLPPWFLLLF